MGSPLRKGSKDSVKAISQLLPTRHTPIPGPSQSGDRAPHLSCLRAEVLSASLTEAEGPSWVPRTYFPITDSPEPDTRSWYAAETQSEDAK